MVGRQPKIFLLGEQPQGRRAWKKRKIQRGADTNTEEEEECESGKELPFYTFHFSLFTFRRTLEKADSGKLRSALPFTFHFTFYLLPFLKMRFTY